MPYCAKSYLLVSCNKMRLFYGYFYAQHFIVLLTCRLTTKIYWTKCHPRLLLLFDIPRLCVVIVHPGGAQVKILDVEEIGDLVQGNAARLLRVLGRNKPFCRRGVLRFPPIIQQGMMDLIRNI